MIYLTVKLKILIDKKSDKLEQSIRKLEKKLSEIYSK